MCVKCLCNTFDSFDFYFKFFYVDSNFEIRLLRPKKKFTFTTGSKTYIALRIVLYIYLYTEFAFLLWAWAFIIICISLSIGFDEWKTNGLLLVVRVSNINWFSVESTSFNSFKQHSPLSLTQPEFSALIITSLNNSFIVYIFITRILFEFFWTDLYYSI